MIELTSKEGLSEALAAFVTEQDGKFLLDDSKLTTQQDLANAKTAYEKRLAEKLEKGMAKYKGIDPDRHREIEAQLEEMLTKDVDQDRLAEAVKARVGPMEAKLAELQEQNDSYATEAEKIREERNIAIIQKAIRKEVGDTASCEGAFTDIFGRSNGVFTIGDDGNPYGDSGLTPGKFIETLKADSPHLFRSSEGGGARGSGSQQQQQAPSGNTWQDRIK